MNTVEIQKRLGDLRRQFVGARSMLEMMADNTPREYLEKMRREKLEPIQREIRHLEEKLKEDPK